MTEVRRILLDENGVSEERPCIPLPPVPAIFQRYDYSLSRIFRASLPKNGRFHSFALPPDNIHDLMNIVYHNTQARILRARGVFRSQSGILMPDGILR